MLFQFQLYSKVNQLYVYIYQHIFLDYFPIYVITENDFTFFISYLIYFWLHWIFVGSYGLSLIVATGVILCFNVWASHCGGFSYCGAKAKCRDFSMCSIWTQ